MQVLYMVQFHIPFFGMYEKCFYDRRSYEYEKLEIVQVMRAFACASIFLYHLPVTRGERVIIRLFRWWSFFIFT